MKIAYQFDATCEKTKNKNHRIEKNTQRKYAKRLTSVISVL